MIDRTLILWFLFFVKEDDIETPFGNLHVAIQGDRSKLAILTFHDIGLNSKSMHGNICLLIVTNQISSYCNKSNLLQIQLVIWLYKCNCQILFSVIHYEMKYRILHIRSKFEFAVWYRNAFTQQFLDITCFQGFFNFTDMQPILRHFCVYHVNAPGQEDGALHLRPE